MLILSRFAGAARECTSALLVNPHDPEGVAIAIDRALSMCLEERQTRHVTNYNALLVNDLSDWAERFLAVLSGPDGEKTVIDAVESMPMEAPAGSYFLKNAYGNVGKESLYAGIDESRPRS